MNKETYINRIKYIRNLITDLVDELQDDPENKECFEYIGLLRNQVIHDILYGYEYEDEE